MLQSYVFFQNNLNDRVPANATFSAAQELGIRPAAKILRSPLISCDPDLGDFRKREIKG